jgi:hypothetical protein
MCKIALITAAALLASASAALGAPASVTVSLGPKLQAKAERTYGVREVNDIAADLQKAVDARLAKTGAFDGGRIELVLVDATPNRPTFKQLSDLSGLAPRSFGLGGATIEGRAIKADGTVIPLAYSDYPSDIREARNDATWTDAEAAIQRFAYSLGRRDSLARR